MNPPLRPEVEEAFAAALESPEGDREEFLTREYAHAPQLLAEAKSLLRAWHAAGSFLEAGAAGCAPAFPEKATATVPANIGRYRILGLLGEGGMGSVYEAEQEQPRRRVALKVIQPGLAGPELLRRFEQEFQALGRLQHAGIAQIYEAGAADSGFGPQPFFAMELIRGESLLKYADACQLDWRQRLALMAKACEAVHHAHQRGIVHRDLKPGNILVDESGQPKILDFGVARILNRDAQATEQTDLGQLVGTLAYMSPEQVLGDPLEVDTRSDVYALGVIMFELLSGRLPYRIGRRLHEGVRTILEADPVPLSSINRIYRGDVETIAAKALEKDKSRRYSSAAELGADIQRCLSDEPVAARRPSTSYHLQKFARRHRALVSGLAAVFCVLIAGAAASRWEANRARRAEQAALSERDRAAAAEIAATKERDRAVIAESVAMGERNRAVAAEAQAFQERNRAIAEQRHADRESTTARAINDFLEKDLLAQASASAQARPDVKPDPGLTVRTALDRASERIGGRFEKQPLVEASIRQTIGITYMDLGLYAEARQQLDRVLGLRRRLLGAEHRDTLDTIDSLGQLDQKQGKYSDAELRFTTALKARIRVLGEEHPETLISMTNLALLYQDQGKYAQAEPLYTRALEVQRRLRGAEHPDTLVTISSLAVLYRSEGKSAQVEQLFKEVLAANRRVHGEEHPETMTSMNNLAVLYWDQGKYDQAEPLYMKVLEGRRRVLGEQHPGTLNSMNNLAALYRSQRRYSEAEPLVTRVLEVRRSVLGAEHRETLNSMSNLARLYLEQGRSAEAEPLFLKALEVRRRVLGEEHPDTLNSLHSVARLYQGQGRHAEAETLFRRVLETRRRLLGPEHPDTLDTVSRLAQVYLSGGQYAEAGLLFAEALEIRSRIFGPQQSETAYVRASLGQARLGQEKSSEAESLVREALKVLEKNRPDAWQRFESQSILGATLTAQARFAEAEPLLINGYHGLLERRATIPWDSRYVPEAAAQRIAEFYQRRGKLQKAAEWRQTLP